MKAILHIGMPKTGTSSIQNTFSTLPMDGVRYYDWHQPNHGAMVSAIDRDPTHPIVVNQSEEKLVELLDIAREKFLKGIAETPCHSFIVSAERMFNRRAPSVKAHFEDIADEGFRVIAYIREPSSYMASAFQQNVKTGLFKLNLKRLMPKYRAVIEDYETMYGAENVELVMFDPSTLHGGDAVLDFAHRVGVPIDPSQVKRDNESLSAEATAILFAERRLAEPYDRMDKEMARENRTLVDNLTSLKGRKFAFSPEITAPILEEFRDEIDWVEARMGTKFPEPKAQADVMISAPRDLLRLANESQEMLSAHVAQLVQNASVDKARDINNFTDALLDTKTRKKA